jgi:CCR4-NOT transcription complex subunit 2
LAAALRQQQQQLLAHQQQMLQGGGKQQSNLYRLAMSGGSNGGTNFNMATEDFPALPGAPPQSGANSGNSGSAPTSSPSLLIGGTSSAVNSSQVGVGFVTGASRAPSGSSGLYSSDLDNGTGTSATGAGGSQLEGAGLLGGSALGGLGGLGGLQQNTGSQPTQLNLTTTRSSTTTTTSSVVAGSGSATGTALSGDFGLLGLLGVIRMTDADRNALALGSDLTMLGLNLGSSEHIYNTFASPWSESSGSTKEPHYQLPMCYYMQPPALKTGHLSKFQLETLFYIFYALPKDVLQAYAAQELYSREWRYHGDLKLWFKRAGPSDGITSSSTASPQYLYFDINSWERRLFNGNMNQNVTNGFLTEEDVRVKFPNS